MTAAIVWVYLCILLRSCFRNHEKFQTSVNARLHYPSTSFFLENPREYPHKPYIVRNQCSCRKFVPLTVCVYLYQFSDNYFRKSHTRTPGKPARKQNLTRNSHSRYSRSPSCILGSHLTRQCESVVRTTSKVNGKCQNSGSASSETLGSIFKQFCTVTSQTPLHV